MPAPFATPADWPACLDSVDDLTARLRAAQLPVSVGDELRARLLLERLSQAGTAIADAVAAAQWLSPILCRNDDHRKTLATTLGQLDAEAGRRNRSLVRSIVPTASDVPAETPQEAKIESKVRKDRRHILYWVATAAVIALVGSIWIEMARPAPAVPVANEQPSTVPSCANPPCPTPTTPVPATSGKPTSWWTYELGLLPIVLALTVLMLGRRRRAFLMRGLVPRETPQISRLLPATLSELLFRPDRIRTPAADWRRDRWEQSERFDLVRSIDKTVRAGGQPRIVNARRRIVPEYILLVDRASTSDMMAAIADQLVDRLKAEQVNLSRFDFHGDARRVVPVEPESGPARPQRLEDLLLARRGSHQMVIAADATSAFDPMTQQPRAWLKALSDWPDPIWMSPTPSGRQGTAERKLMERGFEIVEVSSDGVAAIGRLLRRESHAALRRLPIRDASPLDALLAEPYRWTGNRPPSDPEIADLIDALERSLEPDALALFAAVAILPITDPRLTLYAAEQLSATRGWLTVLETLVAEVSRLPWLREGYVPEWLRIAMVEWLERAQNRELGRTIRAMWWQLLGRAEKPQARADEEGDQEGDVRIEFVLTKLDAISKQPLRNLGKQQAEALQERILLAFLTETPVRQVAFEAPPNWRDLAPRHWTKFEAIVMGLGLVAAAAMAVWSSSLKALIPVFSQEAKIGIILPLLLAAVGLPSLVVVASYFRQLLVVSRLIQSAITTLLTTIALAIAIAIPGLIGSQEELGTVDFQFVLILATPAIAFVVPWFRTSSFVRLPKPSPVALAFRDLPAISVILVMIGVLAMSIAAEVASNLALPRNLPFPTGTDSPSRLAYQLSAPFVVCSLIAAIFRAVDVSISKVFLTGAAMLQVTAILGGLSAPYVAYTLGRSMPYDPALCDAAAVVLCFAIVAAPISLTYWRSGLNRSVRFVYWAVGLALAMELAKSALAVGMAVLLPGSASHLYGVAWFVPGLIPAYVIACRLARQDDRLPSGVGLGLGLGVMVAAGASYFFATFYWKSTLGGLPPGAAQPISLALEAGVLMLTVRYFAHGLANRGEIVTSRFAAASSPGAAGTRTVLVGLLRIVWPAVLSAALLLGGTAAFVIDGRTATPLVPPRPLAPQSATPSSSSFVVNFNSATDLAKGADAEIQKAALAFRSHQNARITVNGHADSTEGSESFNMALSLRRANAVKDNLVKQGVPATAITVIGRGQTQPAVKSTGKPQTENQRVEITVQWTQPAAGK